MGFSIFVIFLGGIAHMKLNMQHKAIVPGAEARYGSNFIFGKGQDFDIQRRTGND